MRNRKRRTKKKMKRGPRGRYPETAKNMIFHIRASSGNREAIEAKQTDFEHPRRERKDKHKDKDKKKKKKEKNPPRRPKGTREKEKKVSFEIRKLYAIDQASERPRRQAQGGPRTREAQECPERPSRMSPSRISPSTRVAQTLELV